MRAHICAFSIQAHATASPVVDPYRLIDGDSRVGNPIHWAEDKFHVPQCVSKWGGGRDSEGGGARSTAVTSGNYGIGGFVYARICVEPPPPPLPLPPATLPIVVSNRVHWDDWEQEIPCNSNSLNSYAVRLFSTVAPRCSPRPSIYISLPSFTSTAS